MPPASLIQYLVAAFTSPSIPANKPPSRSNPPWNVHALEASHSADTRTSSRKGLLLISNYRRDGTPRNSFNSFFNRQAGLNWYQPSATFWAETRLADCELNS